MENVTVVELKLQLLAGITKKEVKAGLHSFRWLAYYSTLVGFIFGMIAA